MLEKILLILSTLKALLEIWRVVEERVSRRKGKRPRPKRKG